MSIKGNQLNTLVRVDGYPKVFGDGKTKRLEDRFMCKWSVWESLVPHIGSTTPELDYVYLKEISVDRDGDIARIALMYQYPDPLEPIVDGNDAYESRTSVTIDESGTRYPSITWIRRTRKTVFNSNENNVVLNVGKRVNPPGLSSPTAKAWLKTGREVSEGAEYTEIVDTYEWKSGGWPDVYGDGTED